MIECKQSIFKCAAHQASFDPPDPDVSYFFNSFVIYDKIYLFFQINYFMYTNEGIMVLTRLGGFLFDLKHGAKYIKS